MAEAIQSFSTINSHQTISPIIFCWIQGFFLRLSKSLNSKFMFFEPIYSIWTKIMHIKGPVVTDNSMFLLDWYMGDQIREWSEVNNSLVTIPGKSAFIVVIMYRWMSNEGWKPSLLIFKAEPHSAVCTCHVRVALKWSS